MKQHKRHIGWLSLACCGMAFAQSAGTDPEFPVAPLDQVHASLVRQQEILLLLAEVAGTLDELAEHQPAMLELLDAGNGDPEATLRAVLQALAQRAPAATPPPPASPSRSISRAPTLRLQAEDLLYAQAEGASGQAAKIVIAARGKRLTLYVGQSIRTGAERILLEAVEDTPAGLRVRALVDGEAVTLMAPRR